MADDISPTELDKALDEVEAFIQNMGPRDIEPTDITSARIAKRTGRYAQNIKVQLDRMVRNGKLECVGKVRDEGGHIVTAYRLLKSSNG